jgi:hypothetical protein
MESSPPWAIHIITTTTAACNIFIPSVLVIRREGQARDHHAAA